MKKQATKDEREYMARVADLGCAICRRLGYGASPAQVHHKRTGTGRARASHYLTMPLCYEHHLGNSGIHGMGVKAFVRFYGVTEQELIEETQLLLGVDHGSRSGQ